MILLSILIPTITERTEIFKTLLKRLGNEATKSGNDLLFSPKIGAVGEDGYLFHVLGLEFGKIEILRYEDNKEAPIGLKRELLYKAAKGKYSFQLDDDDDISDDFIPMIMEAIEFDKDCITFQEKCTINGEYFSSNHSLKYEGWGQNIDGFNYVRTPFMKSVIKTEIANSVPIPHIRFGEDHEWAKALKPYLKTEIHIDKDLYYYQHTSTDHNLRYGIK